MLTSVGHRSTGTSESVRVTWSPDPGARQRARRRDRRDRGLRGPLAPRAVPVARSRAARFDEQVLMAWDRLALNNPELQYIEVAVSDVPEAEHPALAVFDPADAGFAARITVYRWAIELRADSSRHLTDLLQDVLTEQAGVFLGVAAHDLDSGYPRV
ncbi:MAG: metallopeptidase family protein [Candidatus Nanopelagicales bacterium]|nr:metallopeptidase family protein [Actinomycetota bacterium]HNL51625.1 metallopeptidase family protein [Actinomycetota bacterium]HNO14974.1 metallopeptidase family protein [Actinomycetota bacterium]HUM86120.1 metallopeptidase family protein [Actinomycetota bacterium]